MKAQRRAIIWGRFSSSKQDDGDSRERQDRLNRACAERLGVKVIGEHFDEGVSVKDGATEKFRKLIADLPAGVGIVCENLDRISRGKPWRAKAMLLDIIEDGHFIITSQDEREYNTETIEEIDTLLLGDLSTNLARIENNKRTKRVKEAKANAIELVRQGKAAPLGSWLPPHIKYNFDTKQYDIRPDRLDVVRRIFKEYAAGKGCVSIAKGLNQDKIPTFRFNRGWSQVTIWTMLRYEGLIGVLNYRNERIPKAFPPAIKEDLFYKVQQMCKQNKARHGKYSAVNVRNIFRGVCHCAKCGVSMRVLNDDYIQCRGATLGKCNVSNVVKFSEMEFEFAKWFIEQAKDALLGKDDQQEAIKVLLAKHDAIEERMQVTVDLLDKGYGVNVVAERLAKLEKEKAFVESEVAEIKAKQSSDAVLPDSIQRLGQLIDECQSFDKSITNQETRKKIAAIVPSIVKDVRINLSDKCFPSFEIHLVNGEVHKWAYDVREFAIDTKGKYHVTEGGYVGR
jgi:DNA invertase Pin-like site-specific DNA recombinase